MRLSSFQVSLIVSEFEHIYDGETSQPLGEWGPIAMNNELVHQYIVKQGYYQMKYKFTKPFISQLINQASWN